jgi:hypothetical protein
LDHDSLLAGLSATAHAVVSVALNDPSAFLALDRVPPPRKRSLEELRSAGYKIKPHKNDPFTREQLALVEGALIRCGTLLKGTPFQVTIPTL